MRGIVSGREIIINICVSPQGLRSTLGVADQKQTVPVLDELTWPWHLMSYRNKILGPFDNDSPSSGRSLEFLWIDSLECLHEQLSLDEEETPLELRPS